MTQSNTDHCGRVIAAFPATGKTYIAGRDHRFADSDSSRWSWKMPGARHEDWPDNYMAEIKRLVEGGTSVLCSTHQEVRDALVAAEIPFTLVYPDICLREEYLRRMRDRGSDKRLVDFIGDNWDGLIASCRTQQGCDHIELESGMYLLDVLRRVFRGVVASDEEEQR